MASKKAVGAGSEVSVLSSWREAWQHTGRHSAGEVERVLHPELQAAGRERPGPGLA